VTVIDESFAAEFGTADAEDAARLRNGRYYYPEPGQEGVGPEVGHSRVTNEIKVIADNFALERNSVRTAIRGLTIDESLYLRACAARGLDDDRAEIDTVAKHAQARAGSHEGHTRGTAYHTFSERHDLGQRTYAPSWVRPKLDAYHEALERAELQVLPEYVERRVRLDAFRLIGTLDRIYLDMRTGCYVVGDVKSAREIWGVTEWAAQLGAYANAEHMWDASAGRWVGMPAPMDLTTAVVVWMPRVHPEWESIGKDAVTIEEVDITGAMGALRLCADIKAWRAKTSGKGRTRRRV
jgi:hypothetical protein